MATYSTLTMTTKVMPKLTYLNEEKLKSFNRKKFLKTKPFPWSNIQGFLTQEGFEQLYQDFPVLALFEKHTNIKRGYGQRPHNRYYLAYQNSVYHSDNSKGTIKHAELPLAWQSFLEELSTSPQYRHFICTALDVPDYRVRFAWHVGFSGCEVSPHVDSNDKVGTHIVYFNTSADWSKEWGGSTLVLDKKQTAIQNPDYDDFAKTQAVRITDNHSFLFKNQPEAWHGVEPLSCPEGSYRRLFNIIFEFPPGVTRNQPSTFSLKQQIRSLANSVLRR